MDAATLAIALKAVRSGRQWKCKCVAHEDRSPSMLIFDGRSAVQVRCLAGCDQRDLIAELKRRGLWEAGANERCQAVATNASHETIMRDRARSLFDQSVLCHGTLASADIDSRKPRDLVGGQGDRGHPGSMRPVPARRDHARSPGDRGGDAACAVCDVDPCGAGGSTLDAGRGARMARPMMLGPVH